MNFWRVGSCAYLVISGNYWYRWVRTGDLFWNKYSSRISFGCIVADFIQYSSLWASRNFCQKSQLWLLLQLLLMLLLTTCTLNTTPTVMIATFFSELPWHKMSPAACLSLIQYQLSPVVAECRSTLHHRSQTSWPHHAGAASAALASSSAPSGVQTHLFGASGIVWSLMISVSSSFDYMCAVPRTHNSFGDRTSELPVRDFGTVSHVACEHLTSITNILKHY